MQSHERGCQQLEEAAVILETDDNGLGKGRDSVDGEEGGSERDPKGRLDLDFWNERGVERGW